MPHFIIDCTEKILELNDPHLVMKEVLEIAFSTGLFEKGDIKVRMNPYKHSLVQESNSDFIHVFANIMEGRTEQQKTNLSKLIVSKLNTLFPKVPIISINIRDFEKSSYCNKTMI